MATTRPFTAIRPSGDNRAGFPDGHRSRLEPAAGATPGQLEECAAYLKELLASGELVLESAAALYVYERIGAGGSVTGIYALTSLEDLEKGTLHVHEDTMAGAVAQLGAYRQTVGLESSPVLLTHRRDEVLCALLERAKLSQPLFSVLKEGSCHRFWKVGGLQEITELQAALKKIDQVFVADGHHRLAAAAKLHKHAPQWILSLYVPGGQLEVGPFHRVVVPREGVHLTGASERIGEYFFASLSPENLPSLPEKKNRMGMCIGGTWYRLELRPELAMEDPIDAQFLQQRILSPVFGIAEPGSDPRLRSYAGGDWDRLLGVLKAEPRAIAFTLCAISMGELMSLSLKGKILPPKSTSIGPKPPFGLLMHLGNVAGKDRKV